MFLFGVLFVTICPWLLKSICQKSVFLFFIRADLLDTALINSTSVHNRVEPLKGGEQHVCATFSCEHVAAELGFMFSREC